MSKRSKNPAEAFDTLKVQSAKGKPQPKDLPTKIVLTRIKRREAIFQHRRETSRAHVRDLSAVAKARDLDPLTVWWDGKTWTVIDGHHRFDAYLFAGKGETEVPVEVFQGTPEQALARAAGANTKSKLQMGTTEKANVAWRLVVMAEELSKAEQAQEAGVSPGTVAAMRRAKATLIDDRKMASEALSEMSWRDARGQAHGDTREWSPDEEEKRVAKMALALRKALGSTADRQPDIFMQALERFSPQLANGIASAYRDQSE